MRWAALYRRPPILRGVSASQIRADHAANQARINARYGPALPSSPQLRGEADAAHHSAVISHARASGHRQVPGVSTASRTDDLESFKLQLVVRDLQFSYPDSGRSLVRRDSHK